MNLSGIIYESLNDGNGVRTVIFLSGCKHCCEGCHNPKLFDFEYGKPFDTELQNHIIEYMKNDDLIVGLTVSGGDPIYSSDELIPFLHRVRSELPNNDIWLYTGFEFNQIINNPILNYIDILVDGKFDLRNRDVKLKFKGSSNQRIIDVKESLKQNKVVLWKE